MPEQENVTVGQVAQQAIGRLQDQHNALQDRLREIGEISGQLQDQLRELLSYCEGQAQHSGYALEESAYLDVAQKLRRILDGE